MMGPTEETKQVIKVEISEDYFGGSESPSVKELRNEITEYVTGLASGKPQPVENKEKLLENIKKPMGRNAFAGILEKYAKPQPFESWEAFTDFAEVIKGLLTEFANEKNSNYKTLQSVLIAGKNVFSKVYFLPSALSAQKIEREH